MVSKDIFLKIVDGTFNRMKELTATKGEEYSNSDDQLANFKRSAMEAKLTQEQVWLVFFNKHVDSIKYYIQYGKVKSNETIEDRIDDAILYLILLKAMALEGCRGFHPAYPPPNPPAPLCIKYSEEFLKIGGTD